MRKFENLGLELNIVFSVFVLLWKQSQGGLATAGFPSQGENFLHVERKLCHCAWSIDIRERIKEMINKCPGSEETSPLNQTHHARL